MKEIYVLDACALIAFFNDETGADIVENLLVKAEHNEIRLIINKINMLEIYYGVYRDDGQEVAENLLQTINNLPVEIVSKISDEVFKEAGKLKATNKISLADSIAIAEANVRHSPIVTADHHELDALEKQNIIKVLWIR